MSGIAQISMRVARSGNEGQQSVSVSTSSAATTNQVGAKECLVYSTVECFAVAGTSPTATVANGTPIPANALVRLSGFDNLDKIAFISASGTGTAYVRPAA